MSGTVRFKNDPTLRLRVIGPGKKEGQFTGIVLDSSNPIFKVGSTDDKWQHSEFESETPEMLFRELCNETGIPFSRIGIQFDDQGLPLNMEALVLRALNGKPVLRWCQESMRQQIAEMTVEELKEEVERNWFEGCDAVDKAEAMSRAVDDLQEELDEGKTYSEALTTLFGGTGL